MQQKQYLLQNKILSYRTAGSGPALVLVHGFGEDGTVWSEQFEALRNFRLIVPDLPGSGGSDMQEDRGLEGLADAIFQLLQHLEIKACTMIGHSMGGYVTLAFAEKYPGMLSGFGLFHSTAYPDSEEKKRTREKGIASIGEKGAAAFLKDFLPNLFSEATKLERPGLIEEQIEAARNFSDAALVMYFRSMMHRPDRTQVLKSSKVPVLFILGKYDNAVPVSDGLRLCHLPSLSYIHILDKSAHMGMKEEREESNLILLNYLQSIPG